MIKNIKYIFQFFIKNITTTKIDYSDCNDAQSTPAMAVRGGEEIALPQKIIVLYFTIWSGGTVEGKKPGR